MKRLNNLYDNMISYRNINFVFNKVKNNCHNKKKIFEFIKYKNCNFIDILEKLKHEKYIFSKYSIFLIHEKKYRIIMSENVKDKIVNQLISYFILLPCLNCLIDSNIATRKDKGTSYGYKLLEKHIRSIGINKNIYVLKIDIKKYFYNIDHNILFDMLKKKIKDKKSLNILKDIISLTDYNYINKDICNLINREINRIKRLNITNHEKEIKINELKKIPLYEKGKGLSIGCLSNQLLAIFYLNDLDHYIKEKLKHKYYIRYMDDLYILDIDKEKLIQSFSLIKEEINKLKLDINNKSGIYKLSEGISFLGYTFFIKNSNLIIKYTNNTIKKIDRKLKKTYRSNFNFFYKSLNSYKGYFIKCNTNLLKNKYVNLLIDNRYDKYKLLKRKYCDYYIFIKYKNKYYTYDSDFQKLKELFYLKFNVVYGNKFIKIINKIDKFVLLDGNDIVIKIN